MRRPVAFLLPLLTITACTSTLLLTPSADAQSSSWWPSKDNADAAPTQPAYGAVPAMPGLPSSQPTGGEASMEDEKNWMFTSPFANVSWPEIKMPKLKWKPFGGAADPASPQATSQGSPLSAMRGMSQNVAQRTRTAWNKTVDRLKWNKDTSRQPKQPGFFARMFGSEEQNSGPQTVTQFLAQERPGTTTR